MRTGNSFLARSGTPFKLGLIITVAAAIALVVGPAWQKRLDSAAADSLTRILGGGAPSGKVVIVRADRESIRRLGPWPWSASVHARLINVLNEAGAGAVAFHFPLGWKGREGAARLDFIKKRFLASGLLSSGREAIEFYNTLNQTLPGNGALGELSEALAAFSRVVLPATRGDEDNGDVDALGISPDNAWAGFELLKVTGLSLPPENLRKWAAGIGVARIFADPDNILRSGPLFVEYRERLMPTLGLEVIRVLEGLALSDVRPAVGEGVRLGARLLPTDSSCRLYLNYRSPARDYTTYSYGDVIEGDIPPATLKERIVLVTGPESAKIHLTPLSLINEARWTATLVDNIYTRDPMRPSSWTMFLGLLLLGAAGLLASIIMDRATLLAGSVSCLLLFFSVVAVAGLITAKWHLVFNFSAAALTPIIIFLATALVRFPGLLSPGGAGAFEAAPDPSSFTFGGLDVAWSNPPLHKGGMFITSAAAAGTSTLLILSADGPSGYLPGLSVMARSLASRGHPLEEVADIVGEAYLRGGELRPALRFLGLTFKSTSNELSLLNAGHPSPMLIKSGERGFKSLGRRGEPLTGERPAPNWAVKAFFERGDLLVLPVGLKDRLIQERLGEIAVKMRDAPASRIARRLNLTLTSSKPGGGQVPGVVVIKNG